MTFSFKDIYISTKLKFSVGVEEKTSRYYVSFLVPTNNRQSDYEIYYWLSKDHYEDVHVQPEKIYSYVLECSMGLHRDIEIDLG